MEVEGGNKNDQRDESRDGDSKYFELWLKPARISGDHPKSAKMGERDRDGKTSRTRGVAEMLK